MKIGIVGGGGRMGQMLIRQVARTDGATLAGVTDRDGAPALGQDAGLLAGLGPLGVPVTADPVALFAAADAVIDFTSPAATPLHAKLAAEHQTALIVGTTGLDEAAEEALAVAALSTPILQAPNMSLGVVLLSALVERVARSLDIDWDIEIVEMHHRHKVDAPSGTALALGQAAARGRNVDLADQSVRSRDGFTGPRTPGTIGFATLRGGDVIGDHTVTFAGQGERIELSHKAQSRDIFAAGAVRAALWCSGRSPGRYTMTDVLGLDQ
ncbi:4-hydroxy-tetrahydrodipicolinate reductase [Elstera cyanobacteriorum]|uniref:4-hydroxy-tetrahydrodipicolinate reductase n=1 Tax=Elstera cyanobacteriorum TaxID=2022747 RepID=UPI002355FDD2|nr:4-hydroxy-tetrahydrodipicolinate reductase [Elstera cyanobacteriorum]MCK6441215.1 4-hydroxy-tetrahydrodipicolinate reductase [Elstera cyanobacteriorum]